MHLLGCPRVAPDWELGALRALMKPQTKGAILHRPSEQAWPADAAGRVEAAAQFVRGRLAYEPRLHFPAVGDYHFVIEVPDRELPHAMALAVILSNALPGVWLVLDRLYVRDGRFFRRERGVKLNLVPATNIHLSREIRGALRRAGSGR